MLINTQIQMSELQSKVIDALRFPMSVLVVFIHASFLYETKDGVSIFEGFDSSLYRNVNYLVIDNICLIAVPLFFFISGYLFFANVRDFSFSIFKTKIKKRITSLLVPYLIWNTLVILLYFIVQQLFPSMVSGRNKPIVDFTLLDYMRSFVSMKLVNVSGVNEPIDGPLWFVRDLMVMCVCSPIVFYLNKWTKWIWPLASMLLWLSFPSFLLTPSNSAIFFFSLGSYLAMNKVSFVEMINKTGVFPLLLFPLLIIIRFFIYDEILAKVEIIVGIIFAVRLVTLLVEREIVKRNDFLLGSTFFLFAAHNEILKVFIRFISRIGIQNQFFYIVAYFVCAIAVILIVLSIYWLLKKSFPKIASVLSGGR